MGMRNSCLVLILVMILTTVGCSNEKVTTYENDISKDIAKNTEQAVTPPKLTVSIEGNTIIAGRGSYSWSIDNGDGTTKSIHADTGPPPEFASKEIFVKSQSKVHLIFDEEPSDYQVEIWETDNKIVVTDNTYTITQNKGSVLYLVVANWEQGTATYAFSLSVK